MSFGFSTGDIAALVKLTARTYNGWKNACGNYANITSDLITLQKLLERVDVEAKAPNSLFARNPDDLKGLKRLCKSCRALVEELEEILKKYKSLGTSQRKNWDRIKMGNKNLESLDRKLMTKTEGLSTFLTVVGISSQGRLENEVVPKILQRMDHIAAQVRGGNESSATALTAYDNDDKAVWREFRREMISAGICSGDIRKHSAALKFYLAHLQREGLLDEDEPPNEISTSAPTQTPSPQAGLLLRHQHHSSPTQTPTSYTGDTRPLIRESKRVSENMGDIRHSEDCSNEMKDNHRNAGEPDLQEVETQITLFGLEYPDTVRNRYNLAVTYWFQGQYEEAEKLGVQVVEDQKQVLGPEHPATLSAMENLGSTYSRQERWKEAEELGVQVLETRKRVLGLEHPDTLLAMHNLALIFESQNRKDEAFPLMERCYRLCIRNLGERHPCTESSRQALTTLAGKDCEITNLATSLCTVLRT